MKRKSLKQREPNGKPKRSGSGADELLSPGEVQRLRAAAARGLRDPVWGSMAGYLLLTGKITAREFAAAKRWSETAAAYEKAMLSPSGPRTAKLERGDRTTSLDVLHSESDAAAIKQFVNAFVVLQMSGASNKRAVIRVCERDQAPLGEIDLGALRAGLQVLAMYWQKNSR